MPKLGQVSIFNPLTPLMASQSRKSHVLDKMGKIFQFRFSISMMSQTRSDVKNKLEGVEKSVLYQKNQQNLHISMNVVNHQPKIRKWKIFQLKLKIFAKFNQKLMWLSASQFSCKRADIWYKDGSMDTKKMFFIMFSDFAWFKRYSDFLFHNF